MIVVSDTSPINYLLLINQIELLPHLYQQVLIPDVVHNEMMHPDAPSVLQQWIATPPPWLVVQPVSVIDPTLNALDPGEQAAITLAQVLQADLLLIDERTGRQAASDSGLPIIGILGVLDDAATQGLINISTALTDLQQTNFRASRRLIQTLLRKHNEQA
jgi:predicted nucleic acid-binding protein